jgi:mRNA-degrading endonuclease toxin of MazEF toxin-antitoxin module
VVQTDAVRERRVRSFFVVPLTSRLHVAGLPGNLRLDKAANGLDEGCVANLYDVQKVLRGDFLERVGRLPSGVLGELDEALRLVLHL